MSNQFIDSPWQELYKAAIFEEDGAQLATRIAEAESAIIARGRTLFQHSQDMAERKALDRSLYFLRILRSCSRPRAAA